MSSTGGSTSPSENVFRRTAIVCCISSSSARSHSRKFTPRRSSSASCWPKPSSRFDQVSRPCSVKPQPSVRSRESDSTSASTTHSTRWLGDGARGNWTVVSELCPLAIQILDVPHAVHWGMQCGKALLGEGHAALPLWEVRIRELLDADSPDVVIAELMDCLPYTSTAEHPGAHEARRSALGNSTRQANGPPPRRLPHRRRLQLPPRDSRRPQVVHAARRPIAIAAQRAAPGEAQLHPEPIQLPQPGGCRLKVIVHPTSHELTSRRAQSPHATSANEPSPPPLIKAAQVHQSRRVAGARPPGGGPDAGSSPSPVEGALAVRRRGNPSRAHLRREPPWSDPCWRTRRCRTR